MGGASSKTDLKQGQGYRVITVRNNSPFDGKVEPFFDFILSVEIDESILDPQKIDKKSSQQTSQQESEQGSQQSQPLQQPSQQQPSQQPIDNKSKQILNRITTKIQVPAQQRQQLGILQLLAKNQGKRALLNIISTKHRIHKKVEVIPNTNWNGSKDPLGITIRKQRYDEAFDCYFPMQSIAVNSPILKAGVQNGQYLIGCKEFAYSSLDGFMEELADRFFDKEVPDKVVNLAIYDIITDELIMRAVELNRGWGGKGLLGSEFMQGMLNRFPIRFEETRKMMLERLRQKKLNKKALLELSECDGVSKGLVQTLRQQKHRKIAHLKNLKTILSINPPQLPKRPQQTSYTSDKKEFQIGELREKPLQNRMSILEDKMSSMENKIQQLSVYIDKILSLQQQDN